MESAVCLLPISGVDAFSSRDVSSSLAFQHYPPIPSELEDMRSNNIIENITIKLGAIVKMDEGCKLGDDWDRLDEVLMRLGWFALKRVSLIIEVYIYSRSPKKLLEEVAVQIASDTISMTFKKQVYFVQIRLTLG